MPTQTAFLHCPNSTCETVNSEHHQYCQTCGTRLLKRYLWAARPDLQPLDQILEHLEPGQRVGDRYLYKCNRIFLDTKPGIVPHSPTEILPSIQIYLKLFAYRLHLPQPYTLLNTSESPAQPLLLLESAPLNQGILETSPTDSPLMPSLREQWRRSTPLRQLHWLWQLAHLWQPLKSFGVANSLLDPHLLRVQGPVIRFLELRSDRHSTPNLSKLGQVWSPWAEQADPMIRQFLQHLVQALREQQFHAIDQVIAELDQALTYCSQTQKSDFTVATATDTGPSRSHNEDACYPAPPSEAKTLRLSDFSKTVPVLVCDGIGGHDGGEVASEQAIETLLKSLKSEQISSATQSASDRVNSMTQFLDRSIRKANTAITDRNDREHRQERQRMGTTLVMALVPPPVDRAHELYIAHVGDSRIYWISKTGCYQVTLDDDLACREVRLGYSLYRNALQNRSAGALVQALGMGESSLLHPTIGRLILDEDGIVLLCSDGLSDGDRVEHYWEQELLPVLEGKLDLAAANQSLVELANSLNGHDNVTVGLIHYQFQPTEISPKPLTQLFLFDRDRTPGQRKTKPIKENQPTVLLHDRRSTKTQRLDGGTSGTEETLISESTNSQGKSLILELLMGITLLLILGTGIVYLFRHFLAGSSAPTETESPAPSTIISPSPDVPSSSPSPVAPSTVEETRAEEESEDIENPNSSETPNDTL